MPDFCSGIEIPSDTPFFHPLASFFGAERLTIAIRLALMFAMYPLTPTPIPLRTRCLLWATIISTSLSVFAAAQSDGNMPPVPGLVRNVAVGAGGYVTGVFADPNEKGLFYIRTDMGGAYRWDAAKSRWVAILDKQGASDFGIDSIAVDPSNARTVYIQTGKYLYDKAHILKSTDAGDTWTKLPTPRGLASSGNGTNRMIGERLQVDPNMPDTLVLASRTIGLWKTTDGGAYWDPVDKGPGKGPFPKGEEKHGLSFVTFDKESGKKGEPTPILYVGVFEKSGTNGGIWKSVDAGANWTQMQGGPKTPSRAAVASDGTLYVAFMGGKEAEGGVFKADRNSDTLTNCSPEPKVSYCALAIDPTNPKTIYTSQYGSYRSKTFASTNGGASWSLVSAGHGIGNPATRDSTQWFGNISQLVVNPFDPKEIWMGDLLGVLRTPDITDVSKPWDFIFAGHEEIVPLILVSAPSGAPLHCGSADVNGHRFIDFTVPPADQFKNPSYGSTTGIDFCEADPNVWARVYKSFVGAPRGGFSKDNGATWTPFRNIPPDVEGGRIAVSASNPNVFVWSTEKGKVLYTKDQGTTWAQATSAPSVCSWEFSQNAQCLASDRVDPDTFYIFKDVSGKPQGHGEIWRSTDGGQTWAISGTMPYKGHTNLSQYKLITSPSGKGKLWMNLGHEYICKSSDGGQTFTTVPDVNSVGMIAFGKPAPGKKEPTVFLFGSVQGKGGLFRSDDDGATWKKIEMSSPINNEPKIIGADRQTFGRAYIGTDGRGIYVIDSD